MRSDDSPSAVVGSFRSSCDAEFARSLLRSAGIESFVSNDVAGVRYDYVQVSVQKDDEAEARQILRGLPSLGSPSSRDEIDDAIRVGFVGGAMGGGVVGAIVGWLWSGIGLGAAVGIAVAVQRWRSRHANG